jgi:hypothetical protein
MSDKRAIDERTGEYIFYFSVLEDEREQAVGGSDKTEV